MINNFDKKQSKKLLKKLIIETKQSYANLYCIDEDNCHKKNDNDSDNDNDLIIRIKLE